MLTRRFTRALPAKTGELPVARPTVGKFNVLAAKLPEAVCAISPESG